MRVRIINFLPLLIGITISVVLGYTIWWGFYPVFTWIGASISTGIILEEKLKRIDIGRKLALLLILPVFLVYFGVLQRENMQIEETVIYFCYFITAGIFTRVLIHFAIAKIFGPLIWGRGFCGWACWTAGILECLPIKENDRIPHKYTYFRVLVLIVSLVIPIALIANGYDYYEKHVFGIQEGIVQKLKFEQFVWFLIGNAIYMLQELF